MMVHEIQYPQHWHSRGGWFLSDEQKKTEEIASISFHKMHDIQQISRAKKKKANKNETHNIPI